MAGTRTDDRQALRRLCAGTPDAGRPDAKLHSLDGLDGIERIVQGVLVHQPNTFLVPSDITAGLTRKLGEYIGITDFDEASIEALFENSFDGIARLAPTEQERDAILRLNLSPPLLRRLPIHVHSDGAVGSAEGLFLVIDWLIPDTLKAHVRTVRRSDDPVARRKQQDIVLLWSPKTQIQTALSLPETHRFQQEILDALADVNDIDSIDGGPKLGETPWLLVNDLPVSPADVLDLPPPVAEAVRALLLNHPAAPTAPNPFATADMLPADVSKHPGFSRIRKHLLPDQFRSLDALARNIERTKPIGRLGTAENYPVDVFAELANADAGLTLPGWPLLAAVLRAFAHEPGYRTHVVQVVSSFKTFKTPQTPNPVMATRYLNALANCAGQSEPRREAARRAHEYEFEAVAAWPDKARRAVFGATLVPTAAGGWRRGSEVVEAADGVTETHLLAADYGSMLRRHRLEALPSVTHPVDSDAGDSPPHGSGSPAEDDFSEIEALCVERHRSLLEAWRGKIPSDLVILYLGLIGRYPAIERLAEEWQADATASVDDLWRELDQRLQPGLEPEDNPLRNRVDGRCFRITEIGGLSVPAVALSGDRFDAPLDHGFSGLLVGNTHKTANVYAKRCLIHSSDGSRKLLIDLAIRDIDSNGYSTADATAAFRRLVEAVAVDCLLLRGDSAAHLPARGRSPRCSDGWLKGPVAR